jgi:hypothetical protein
MKRNKCEHVNAKALRFIAPSFVNVSTHTCNDNASFLSCTSPRDLTFSLQLLGSRRCCCHEYPSRNQQWVYENQISPKNIFLCTDVTMRNHLGYMTLNKLMPPINQTIKFKGRRQKSLD